MMLVLYAHVFLMRRCDVERADTWNVVNIHINRHVREFGCLNILFLCHILAPFSSINTYNFKQTDNALNITEAYGEAKIEGIYYGDSIGTNIMFPSGKVLHLRLMRSK